jgi:GT2 family glycosyltransferase
MEGVSFLITSPLPLSVIIVNWNGSGFLRKCLSSLRQSTVSIKEIIVVDNASEDGSQEMVLSEFPEVTLIQCNKNLGFARANNIGLERASGANLALINSDVVVHPNCLEKLTELLDRYRDIGLIGPELYGADGNLQRTYRTLPNLWTALCRSFALDTILDKWALFSGKKVRTVIDDGLLEVDVLSGCFWVARRAAVSQVGGLDEQFFFYAEDLDWCKRFREAGWKIAHAQVARSIHLGGASSANAHLRYSIEIVRANLSYWKKHFGWLGQIAYYVLSVIHHLTRLCVQTIKSLVKTDSHEAAFKRNRSFVCLRWLLTGREV